ncbi:MAG: hypothetical protein MZV70_67750 [Desulfobacterales bacterium]|nr:hypothetical protein [Desulfobacterales bacterium]
MTVHKSQGSEFDEVLLVLPDADSPGPHPRTDLHGPDAGAQAHHAVRPSGGHHDGRRPRASSAPPGCAMRSGGAPKVIDPRCIDPASLRVQAVCYCVHPCTCSSVGP